MRLMIDTNIFLDVFLDREPFYEQSKAVLDLCERKKVEGFLSATSVTDFFYLIHRHFHSSNLAYRTLGSVLNIVNVMTVTNLDVIEAYEERAADFEDCLLAVCARKNRCDGIVTRNKNDFSSFGLTLWTPEELINHKGTCDGSV